MGCVLYFYYKYSHKVCSDVRETHKHHTVSAEENKMQPDELFCMFSTADKNLHEKSNMSHKNYIEAFG